MGRMLIHDFRLIDPLIEATYKPLGDLGRPKWQLQSTEVMTRAKNKHESKTKEHIKYTQPHSWFPNPQILFLEGKHKVNKPHRDYQ